MDTATNFRTRFNSKMITVDLLEPGQTVALATMARDEEGNLAKDGVFTILEVVEGCVGPDQWRDIRKGLALKTVSIADVMALFSKITEKSAKAAETPTVKPVDLVPIPATFSPAPVE